MNHISEHIILQNNEFLEIRTFSISPQKLKVSTVDYFNIRSEFPVPSQVWNGVNDNFCWLFDQWRFDLSLIHLLEVMNISYL